MDWDNDGIYDQFGITGSVTHDFGTAGTYTIRIQGDFPRIRFAESGEQRKILSIDQWGEIGWDNMSEAFKDASNFQINAIDFPDLSNVTDMSHMFQNALVFNQPIDHWDVSNVTDMSHMFQNALNFNQPIDCLLYTSPSPRDQRGSRMPSSA